MTAITSIYCSIPPTWVLAGKGEDDILSCTDHVSGMISENTVVITRMEWPAEHPRRCYHLGPEPSPLELSVCPYCKEKLTRAHWKIEGDWRVVWVCSCKPDPDVVAAIYALREKTGECVIAMFGA